MPIYEYRCTQCGERFDVRQAIDEDGSKVTCPKCQAGNPRKLLPTFFSTNSSESSDISCPTCSSGVCGLPPM